VRSTLKDGWQLQSSLGTIEEKVAAVHSIAQARKGYGDVWLFFSRKVFDVWVHLLHLATEADGADCSTFKKRSHC